MKFKFEHVGLIVSDIDRSIQFYRDILGLKVIGEPRVVGGEGTGSATIVGFPGARRKIATLQLDGNLYIELIQSLFPEGKKTIDTQRYDVGSPHISFTVDDVQRAYEELKAKGIRIVNPPATNYLGGQAFYFLDPDGITLAIAITFPPKSE